MSMDDRSAHDLVGDSASRSLLTRQMVVLFTWKSLAFLFTFAIPVVLVRLFSQYEFGVYKQIFLLNGVLLSVLGMGIPCSLLYFLPRDVKTRGTYIFQTIILLSVIGVALAIGVITLRGHIATLLNSPNLTQYIPAIGVMTAVMLVGLVLESTMVATQQYRLAGITFVLSELLKTLIIIGGVIITGSLYIVLLGLIGLGLLRLMALAYFLWTKWLPRLKLSHGLHLRSQLTYALPYGIGIIFEVMANAAPQFIVSYSFDPATFAIFSVGCFTLPLVPIVFESVSDATLIKITELVKTQSFKELVEVLSDSIRKLSVFCFPLTVFLLTVADDFILGMFTNKFHESINIFIIFAFTIPLLALSVDYVPRAFAKTWFLMWMYGARLILAVALMVPLIKAWGLPGAALAVVAGLAITRLYALLMVARFARTTLTSLLPLRMIGMIVFYSLIAALPVYIIKWNFHVPALVFVGSALLVYGSIYLLLIWSSGLIHVEEKSLMVEYCSRLRSAFTGCSI